MAGNHDFVAIDIGNTAIKFGVFINQEITEVHRVYHHDIQKLTAIASDYQHFKGALVSVSSEEFTDHIARLFPKVIPITRNGEWPFIMNYATPETLGMDRICNAAALTNQKTASYRVAIDIGTCVKFDALDPGLQYLGGSISPGIDLRYQALHAHTAKLPLLNKKDTINLIGNSTVSSMQSGVINGMQAEINGLIKRYEQDYKDLTFFVTGGDAQCFDFEGKNNIFVDENLTLKGIQQIYLCNA